ncbi:MAG TPA: sugar ABC transporter permease [Aggregatilineaceae bacterium]|nr:sugar ABC transporter permease [Aggregatilineaceae bacterium]
MSDFPEAAPTKEAVFVRSRPVRPTNYLSWMVRSLVIIIALIFALFPVIWITSASFNTNGSMSTQRLIPSNAESLNDLLVNYRQLFEDPQIPFWHWMWNSVVIASISTVLILMITSFSAYSFSRFRFQGRRNLLLGIFLVQVFPNILAMVALYLMLSQVGDYIPQLGLNTYGGLILVYMGGGMAMNIWLMKGFFDTIPRDIDESAQVDGATHWQAYIYLIFPLVRPVMAVVGLLAFVGTFNDFVLARIMLGLGGTREQWTLMVGMYSFVGSTGEFSTEWGVFAAGSLIAAVPIVILYLVLQRFIVGGLTVGAVKG